VERGARLLVRDIWYEGQIWHFLHFTDRGEFTYCSGNIAPVPPDSPDGAIMAFDNFRGQVTLCQIEPMNGPLRVTGGPGLDLLMLGLLTRGVRLQLDQAQGDHLAFLNSRSFRPDGTGSASLPEQGLTHPDFLRERLAPLRSVSPRPLTAIREGLTDLRLYRVMAYGKEGVRLEGTQP
jgi:hypothetical protein